jgi:hypothetical protein
VNREPKVRQEEMELLGLQGQEERLDHRALLDQRAQGEKWVYQDL